MDRQLASTLKDLGLTTTDAAVYVALLERCGDGPLSAYKLAQDLGRDPANLTKVLTAMVKRGAAVSSGKRPKLYAPTPPRQFIGSLVSNLQARQDQAVTLLERIGTPPDDGRPHLLESRSEVLETARQLLAEATDLVVVSATGEWLAQLAPALQAAAERPKLAVHRPAAALSGAPGPWLRLVVDGRACLVALAQPTGEVLLHGHWSRNPAEAFLVHQDLLQAAVLNDVLTLLKAGTSRTAVRRRADEQRRLLNGSLAWSERWQELGLADYAAPDVAADGFTPETPGLAAPAAAAAAAGQPDDDGAPLQFVFKRKRPK